LENNAFSRKPTLGIVCLFFLVCFLLVTFCRPSLSAIDIAVNQWASTTQSGTVTFLAVGVSFVFDTTRLVFLSIAIAGLLFLKGYKPQGLLLLGAMGGDALLVEIVKNWEQVSRPMDAIVPSIGFSYPSGHSAGIVVFGGVLAYFAWRHWRSTRSHAGIAVSLGVLVGVVGFDRVYLNVHWFSDVLGGLLLGAFWLSFVVLVFSWLRAAGAFGGKRFDLVANWLYVVAVVVAILVVAAGFIV
jgi:membrane-associated phospholipid phosphatase